MYSGMQSACHSITKQPTRPTHIGMAYLQDEDTSLSLGELVREPHGIAAVAFEIVSTLGMLPFLYIEGCTMVEYGIVGWFDFWYRTVPFHALVFSFVPADHLQIFRDIAYVAAHLVQVTVLFTEPQACPAWCQCYGSSLTPVVLSDRNVLDVGAYGLQVAIVVMHLSRAGLNSNALSVIMAIQVLLLWIKIQYYARYSLPFFLCERTFSC